MQADCEYTHIQCHYKIHDVGYISDASRSIFAPDCATAYIHQTPDGDDGVYEIAIMGRRVKSGLRTKISFPVRDGQVHPRGTWAPPTWAEDVVRLATRGR